MSFFFEREKDHGTEVLGYPVLLGPFGIFFKLRPLLVDNTEVPVEFIDFNEIFWMGIGEPIQNFN